MSKSDNHSLYIKLGLNSYSLLKPFLKKVLKTERLALINQLLHYIFTLQKHLIRNISICSFFHQTLSVTIIVISPQSVRHK
jgi:hypothetical protein